MSIRRLRPGPEWIIAGVLVADILGISLGSLWVFFGDPTASSTRTYTWHGGRPVRAVAFSPNGRLAASGGDDGAAVVWDIQSHRSIRRFDHGTGNTVSHLVLTPDGRHLITGCSDGTLRLWDVRTGRELRRFTQHSGAVTALAISPSGRRLASSDWDCHLRIHDTATGTEPERHYPGFRIWSLAFSQDGNRLAYAGDDGQVHIWDMARRKRIRSTPRHYGNLVHSAVFSPDGHLLAYGGRSKILHVRDLRMNRELHAWALPAHARSIRFAAGGQYVLVGCGDEYGPHGRAANSIHLRETRTGKLKLRFVGHTALVNCLAVSRDRPLVLSASDDGTVRLWELP